MPFEVAMNYECVPLPTDVVRSVPRGVVTSLLFKIWNLIDIKSFKFRI